MRPRRSTLLGCATTILGVAMLVHVVLSIRTMGDYAPGGPTVGDNAAPAIDALLHGDVAGYVAHQPAVGLTSILLRLPFTGISHVLGGGALFGYQLGAIACLIPLALLAAWLVMAPAAQPRAPRMIAALLLLLNPVIRNAVASGHPEDVLTGVLAIAAVLAAAGGRQRRAAILLGLAVSSKPWGLIALAPVLVALPEKRIHTAVLAGGIAFTLAALPPLADPAAFARALHGEGSTNLVNPLSFWWPLSSSFHLPTGQIAPARLLPLGLSRSQASMVLLSISLVVILMAGGKALRRGETVHPLGLLVLLALTRCACDSTHLGYYYLALLMPLIAWETVSLARVPLMGAAVTLGVYLIPSADALGDPTALWALSTAATLMLGVYVAYRAFGWTPGPNLHHRWALVSPS